MPASDSVEDMVLAKTENEIVSEGDKTLSTQDWIDVAKALLLREGIDAVKIGRLARECDVTRGGFYWRFASRGALLDTLLEDWKSTNTAPIIDALSGPGTPIERFERLVRLWLDERDYSPDYDTAVRNWSRKDAKVEKAVHDIDDKRVEALKSVFLEFGFDETESLVRARITYFHQVGYYATAVRETAGRREMLSETYTRILTGAPKPGL